MLRSRRFGVLVVLIGCCAGLAGARVHRAAGAFPGANGMIAYYNRVPGYTNANRLRTLNPDGSGEATLREEGATGEWSPDGNRLLFSRWPSSGSADVYVVNADGTGEKQLTSGFPAWNASWSPDGGKIVYERSNPANIADGEIWTMNADGTGKTQITSDGIAKWSPSWTMTPAGSKISYVGGNGKGEFALLTVNPDGNGRAELPGLTGDFAWHVNAYDWSPDGTKIAISSYLNLETGCNGVTVTPADIYVYDVAAKTLTDISNTPGFAGPFEQYPAWSPDGTKIAFSAGGTSCSNGSWQYTPWAIYRMNADGGAVVKLTTPELAGTEFGNLQTYDYAPTWQPCTSGTARCTSVAVAKAQSIAFDPPAARTYGDADFTVTATASSGLPVALSAAGDCTVSGTTVHLTGAGSCTLTASQAGNGSWAAAAPVARTFSIAKAAQTITFGALPDRKAGAADFTVAATASSGLRVSFSAVGRCRVTGAKVHLTGAGSCTLRASQAGNANYQPARDVVHSFRIAAAAARAAAHCDVPRVTGKALGAAASSIRAHHCRVGTVRHTRSSSKRGVVIAQSRAPGKVLAVNAKIDLVVSLGGKR
jgi:Tol biopolymer transport system component